MPRRRIQIWGTAAVATFWAAAIAVGVRGLLHYENAPGAVANVPSTWPASQIRLASDRPTLIMLAHPHCPCTRASVGELAEVMADVHGKVAAFVLFSQPAGSGPDWAETGLRRECGRDSWRHGSVGRKCGGGSPRLVLKLPGTPCSSRRTVGCSSAAGSRLPAATPAITPERAQSSRSSTIKNLIAHRRLSSAVHCRWRSNQPGDTLASK